MTIKLKKMWFSRGMAEVPKGVTSFCFTSKQFSEQQLVLWVALERKTSLTLLFSYKRKTYLNTFLNVETT